MFYPAKSKTHYKVVIAKRNEFSVYHLKKRVNFPFGFSTVDVVSVSRKDSFSCDDIKKSTGILIEAAGDDDLVSVKELSLPKGVSDKYIQETIKSLSPQIFTEEGSEMSYIYDVVDDSDPLEVKYTALFYKKKNYFQGLYSECIDDINLYTTLSLSLIYFYVLHIAKMELDGSLNTLVITSFENYIYGILYKGSLPIFYYATMWSSVEELYEQSVLIGKYINNLSTKIDLTIIDLPFSNVLFDKYGLYDSLNFESPICSTNTDLYVYGTNNRQEAIAIAGSLFIMKYYPELNFFPKEEILRRNLIKALRYSSVALVSLSLLLIYLSKETIRNLYDLYYKQEYHKMSLDYKIKELNNIVKKIDNQTVAYTAEYNQIAYKNVEILYKSLEHFANFSQEKGIMNITKEADGSYTIKYEFSKKFDRLTDMYAYLLNIQKYGNGRLNLNIDANYVQKEVKIVINEKVKDKK